MSADFPISGLNHDAPSSSCARDMSCCFVCTRAACIDWRSWNGAATVALRCANRSVPLLGLGCSICAARSSSTSRWSAFLRSSARRASWYNRLETSVSESGLRSPAPLGPWPPTLTVTSVSRLRFTDDDRRACPVDVDDAEEPTAGSDSSRRSAIRRLCGSMVGVNVRPACASVSHSFFNSFMRSFLSRCRSATRSWMGRYSVPSASKYAEVAGLIAGWKVYWAWRRSFTCFSNQRCCAARISASSCSRREVSTAARLMRSLSGSSPGGGGTLSAETVGKDDGGRWARYVLEMGPKLSPLRPWGP